MSNPTGANDIFIPETPYGDVKKQQQLTRAAPISGAPISTAALETPRRSGQQAKRGRTAPQGNAQPEPQPLPVDVTPAPYPVQLAQTWQQIAATPGAQAHPILGQLAAQAAQEAQHGPGLPIP